jgi:hypothetical protein
LPSISKYCVTRRPGAFLSANVYAMLMPSIGFCGTPFTSRGSGIPGHLEDRRRDVDAVVELRAHAAAVGDAFGPRHDQAVARSAEVRRHLLHPLERRRARPAPAHRVVVLVQRATDLVDVLEHERHVVERPSWVFMLLSVPGEGTFTARAVVADHVDDQRVVAQAHRLDRIHHLADLRIDVLEEAGEDLLHPRVEALLVRRARLPRWDRVGPRRQLRALRNEAELLLIFESDLALSVPAVIELALVLVGPFLGDVVRAVTRPGSEVQEEGLVRRARLLLADPGDGLRGDRFREVPAGIVVRRLDRHRVLEQGRVPLTRLAALESVPVVEALSGRPAVERTSRAQLVVGCVVPFAEGRGAVVVASEDLRDRRRLPGPGAVVAGKARSPSP